jgi:hypothetical protein
MSNRSGGVENLDAVVILVGHVQGAAVDGDAYRPVKVRIVGACYPGGPGRKAAFNRYR